MHAWHAEDEDVVAFLKAAIDPKLQPVFVHCEHGSDRTGVCIASYRIAVQGWSKADAAREMTAGGYGFHDIWENLVDYLQDMDVRAMRQGAGIAETRSAGP
jgi:protein tyrosine/serine phosphatase